MLSSIKTVLLILCIGSLLTLLSSCQSSSNEKKIGIIVPLENKALDEIVAGFTETLRAQSHVPLKFHIANAQGDLNLQRAIIQQMKNAGEDIIVPIGTGATQMSASIIKQQPIVSLAANFSDTDRRHEKTCHVAVVHDEISPAQIIAFVHQVYPHISRLTLIHSASDKIFPDVKIAIDAGKKFGIAIHPMMAPTLNDLYSVAHAIPADTQGIVILKDILITSGISTLQTIAQERHLPLITSDQGSVQEGANFALGVHEREIGVEGGKLAAAILAGKSASQLPIVEMTHLTVFLNETSLSKNQQSAVPIKTAANQLHYAIESIHATKRA